MTDSARRMLELLALLQLRREWPGSALADRLGVSERTLRRDVERLRDLDYPVRAIKGPGGGYRLGDGARLPPLQLATDEAVAVAIGLSTAASSNVQGVGEAALRALGKLEGILPARLRGGIEQVQKSVVHVPGSAVVDPAVLVTLAGACRDRFRVRFDYVRGDGAGSLREVEPYRLVTWVGHWYLVAWDVGRADWRTFRVDRLRPRVPLGGRFAPRELPEEDAGAYLITRVRALWQDKASILVHAPVDSEVLRRWRNHAEVAAVDERTTRVRLDGDSLHGLAGMLAELDADFTVESPPELVSYLRVVAARFGAAAGPAPSAAPDEGGR